ncbi:PilZ domain-containing protein [uncultured Phenylobacterium sp.]|uniref:PilZ domain-containing protein n=1 Tax=uncultured Phenylobacterium sp. TaxID=349273 RepID=UPI0025FCA3B7|nr:PilZ domain-containing protein [uncultured Phenylobacterium sp.]
MNRPAPSHHERRAEPRKSVNASARLFHGATLALWADCTIRDLSTIGAKIELPELHVAPPRFVLLNFAAGVAYEAVLKWRRGNMAGTSFEAVHALETATEPRLAPVREQWLALRGGFGSAR